MFSIGTAPQWILGKRSSDKRWHLKLIKYLADTTHVSSPAGPAGSCPHIKLFYGSVWTNFSFYSGLLLFSQIFWMELREDP